jgi:hypothetical protein
MSVMSFIAEMTKALAWPIAVVVVGLIFRRTISNLLEGVRLRRIGKGEWSADFTAAAQEVWAELPSHPRQEAHLGEIDAETVRLADASPAAAISDVWGKLEQRVRSSAAKAGVQQQLLPEILRGLTDKHIIRPATADGILGLRNMRNLAVHAPAERLTSTQAIEFINLAAALMWSLEQELKKTA